MPARHTLLPLSSTLPQESPFLKHSQAREVRVVFIKPGLGKLREFQGAKGKQSRESQLQGKLRCMRRTTHGGGN